MLFERTFMGISNKSLILVLALNFILLGCGQSTITKTTTKQNDARTSTTSASVIPNTVLGSGVCIRNEPTLLDNGESSQEVFNHQVYNYGTGYGTQLVLMNNDSSECAPRNFSLSVIYSDDGNIMRASLTAVDGSHSIEIPAGGSAFVNQQLEYRFRYLSTNMIIYSAISDGEVEGVGFNYTYNIIP